MKKFLMVAAVALVATCQSSAAFAGLSVWLNEIHYDNSGGDVGEAIEIVATSLGDVEVVLYNGNGGAEYDSLTVLAESFTFLEDTGFYIFSEEIELQNGAPDGIALKHEDDTDVQFLSYEGSFEAVGGIADGLTSADIGVSEGGGTLAGTSLQLTGSGSEFSDFTWQAPSDDSFGFVNVGQTLVAVPEPTSLILCGTAFLPMLRRRRFAIV